MDSFKFKPAEQRFRQSLREADQTATGTANTLTNLACVLVYEHKYRESESTASRAVEMAERMLGPNHPYTVKAINALGLSYSGQKKYADAEKQFLQALSITKKTLGLNNPQYAIELANLAQVYDSQHKYREAISLGEKALAITQKFQDSYTESVNSYFVLYHSYVAISSYEKAANLCHFMMTTAEKSRGPESVAVATVLEKYAIVLHKMDRNIEAKQAEQRAKRIIAKVKMKRLQKRDENPAEPAG